MLNKSFLPVDIASPKYDDQNKSVSNGLLSLDNDSLRAVFLRTKASDHPSLRLSCRRICETIDSSIFRKERSEEEFSGVRIELLTPFEQYKEQYKLFYEKYRSDDSKDKVGPTSDDKYFKDNCNRLGYFFNYTINQFKAHDFRVFVDN